MIKHIGIGLAAGAVGTLAMTIAMEAMFRLLPREEQQPLPPRQLTMAATETVGTKQDVKEHGKFAPTLALHFGYGSAVGSLYGPVAARLPFPVPFRGVVFGLAVWASVIWVGFR